MPFKLPPTSPLQPSRHPALLHFYIIIGLMLRWRSTQILRMGMKLNWLLVASDTPSICPLLLVLTQGLAWTPSHLLCFQNSSSSPPTSSSTKVAFFPLGSFEPSQSPFTFSLLYFTYTSNLPCKSELKQRGSAVSPATLHRPLHVLYSGLWLNRSAHCFSSSQGQDSLAANNTKPPEFTKWCYFIRSCHWTHILSGWNVLCPFSEKLGIHTP